MTKSQVAVAECEEEEGEEVAQPFLESLCLSLHMMQDDLEMMGDDLSMKEDNLGFIEDDLKIMEDGQKCQNSSKL
jgi:hypothetical protein